MTATGNCCTNACARISQFDWGFFFLDGSNRDKTGQARIVVGHERNGIGIGSNSSAERE